MKQWQETKVDVGECCGEGCSPDCDRADESSAAVQPVTVQPVTVQDPSAADQTAAGQVPPRRRQRARGYAPPPYAARPFRVG